MSRALRLLVILAAWAVPALWVTTATLSRPSDGTLVSPTTVGSHALTAWPEVGSTLGRTPLRAGDQVRAIEGSAPEDAATDAEAGRPLVYDVVRPGRDGDVPLSLQVEVPVTGYPWWAAVRGALAPLAVLGLVLLTASVVFWRTSTSLTGRLGLLAAALLPLGLTAGPLGPGVVDLAAPRGLWPAYAGRVGVVAAAACAVALAVGMGRRRPPAAWLLVALPPLVAVMAVVLRPGRPLDPVPLVAAGIAAAVAAAVVLLLASRRSDDRPERLATRLVALGLAAGLTVRLGLVDVPRRVTGRELLPADAANLVVAALILACFVVAALRLRVELVEPAVRRGLTQALAVAVVGGLALAGVGAVGLTTGRAVEPMLAGGVVALLVLPLVVVAQRAARRTLLGSRDLPRTVVAELRRLDAAAEPEETLAETLTLLARRLRLSYAAIDSPIAGTVSVGEPRGDRVTVELVVGRTTLGEMHLEPAADRDPFGPGDRRLLEDVGAQVGALVQAVALTRELQQARRRLVAAREEERRRLRRDLHDGLGPSLATLVLRLESASDVVRDDPVAAAALVEQLADRARADIDEVRRLVDGLRPAALDQLGLVSALRDRAVAPGAQSNGFGWTVTADAEVEPLPAAVEVAAYRIAMEAVTNAARHSGATRCEVHLRRADGELELTVQDDGHGLAADAGIGVGMGSMRERAQELGGTCIVTSGEGGTLVRARLPVDEEQP